MARVNLEPGFFEFQGIPDITRTQKDIEEGVVMWRDPAQKDVEYKINERGSSNKNYACEALLGIQELTPFSRLYFSDKNIAELQKLIRYNVYIASDKKYKIGEQDESEIKIIMRSVYLQYQQGIPTTPKGITDGIRRLNRISINQLLPDLLSNIMQYIGYVKDASSPLKPLVHPVNMSMAGKKQNRDITQVLFGQSVAEYNSKFY
jgi:hypothetical protein